MTKLDQEIALLGEHVNRRARARHAKADAGLGPRNAAEHADRFRRDGTPRAYSSDTMFTPGRIERTIDGTLYRVEWNPHYEKWTLHRWIPSWGKGGAWSYDAWIYGSQATTVEAAALRLLGP